MREFEVDLLGMQEAAHLFVADHVLFGKSIALVGSLGAGKTAFVREVLRHLGYHDCSSPTFVLSNVYKLPAPSTNEIEHWDLYRLKKVPEEVLLPPPPYAARFIEWADLFPELLADQDYVIKIDYAGERRKIRWGMHAK